MNFKVGDKVRVRKGLKTGLFVNTQMQDLVGKTLTIKSIVLQRFEFPPNSRENTFYEVKENDWFWTDDMLEPVIEVGDTVRINKNATIEDFTKDSWNGCQIKTLEFIRKHGDTDKTFVVSEISSGNLYFENKEETINHMPINQAIFELVSKKEHKTKEVTMQEVCEKFGCNVVIKKEDE